MRHPERILTCPETGHVFFPWQMSYLGEGTFTASFAFSSSNFVYDDGNQPLLRAESGKKGLVAALAADKWPVVPLRTTRGRPVRFAALHSVHFIESNGFIQFPFCLFHCGFI